MPGIDDLNDEIRRCNAKIEEHLEARALALTTTANVAITLATALAAGIAVLGRDALPGHPAKTVVALLSTAGLLTVASLFLGVFVYVARTGVSNRAVKMWGVSKDAALSALLTGSGDEEATDAAFRSALPEMVEQLRAGAEQYDQGFERMTDLLVWQVSLLSIAVMAALACAFLVFAKVPSVP